MWRGKLHTPDSSQPSKHSPVCSNSIPSSGQMDRHPLTTQGPIPAPRPAISASSHMVFTPNRPPVPSTLTQKILRGEFVDMEELLPDNFPTGETPPSKSKQKRYPVPSLLTWAECFFSYMSIIATNQPARISNLLAFMSVILYAARHFDGEEWKIYDTNFRKQAAPLNLVRWSEINPSFMDNGI